LASRLRDDEAVTAAGFCVGSPSYLAPERLLGRPASPRSDLYSVGVMLYEMIAGVRPFRGDTPDEIARNHLRATPTRLHDLAVVSAATELAVRRAMAKDPAERFASAEEMITALRPCTLAHAWPRARRADPVEDETTAFTICVPGEPAPSRLRRLWGRVRFGAWRWLDTRGRATVG